MDSFDQLIKLANEANHACKEFFEKNQDVSIDQAIMNYYKSVIICKDIEERMKKIEMKKEGSGYGYDCCVYYIAKDSLNMYQHYALSVLTEKLGKKMKELAEEAAQKKQKDTLKQLIKEAVNEARQEELQIKSKKSKKQPR